MGKGIFVFDFDDVLCYLSKSLYSNIRENWRIYKKYFWDPGELTTEQVQSRHFYYLNEWLIHKKYKNLTSEEYSAVCIEIWENFLKTFFKTETIYDNLEPTEFAKKTLMNPLFLEDSNVSQIVILSRNVSKEQTESKERFIRKYFNHPKISYIDVRRGESKADILIKNNINFDVLIDDELLNIRDVAEKFKGKLEKKEFIVPHYGYNENMKELKLLIEAQGGIITYYEPFEKEMS